MIKKQIRKNRRSQKLRKNRKRQTGGYDILKEINKDGNLIIKYLFDYRCLEMGFIGKKEVTSALIYPRNLDIDYKERFNLIPHGYSLPS